MVRRGQRAAVARRLAGQVPHFDLHEHHRKPEGATLPANGEATVHRRKGDVEAAFAECDLVVEETYRTQAVEHAYLEPEAGLAYVDHDGVVTVHSPSQNITHHRHMLARIRGLIAGVLGLLVMTIGLDPYAGVPRMTFGTTNFLQGVHLLVAMVGLFAVPQTIQTLADWRSGRRSTSTRKPCAPSFPRCASRMAAITGLQEAQYGAGFATSDQVAVDYVALAAAVEGVKAVYGGEDRAGLESAPREAHDHDGLSVVHVPVYFGPHDLAGLGAWGQWNVGNWCQAVQRSWIEQDL